MFHSISRRKFLATTTAAAASITLSAPVAASDIELIDFHTHPDGHSIDEIIAIAAGKGVRIGIVEHAGTKENKYPVCFHNDEELGGWIAKLEGKRCFKGIQAEYNDWMGCFSKEMIARLDYVLTDAMTFRDRGNRRVHLWKPQEVSISDPQDFMDRYVAYHEEIMTNQPIDILASPTFLPAILAPRADELWTERRMMRIIDAARKQTVALEISSSYRLPTVRFLRLAKSAGCKFSFGSNGRGQNIGKKDYWLEMIAALELKGSDLFTC